MEDNKLSVTREAILRVLQASAGPLGPKEISDAIGDSIPGLTHNAVRQRIHVMREAGQIVRVNYGRYILPAHRGSGYVI